MALKAGTKSKIIHLVIIVLWLLSVWLFTLKCLSTDPEHSTAIWIGFSLIVALSTLSFVLRTLAHILNWCLLQCRSIRSNMIEIDNGIASSLVKIMAALLVCHIPFFIILRGRESDIFKFWLGECGFLATGYTIYVVVAGAKRLFGLSGTTRYYPD